MSVQIYEHPVSGDSVLPLLESHLPYSLPLLNRIKFYHRTVASHIFASFNAELSPNAESLGVPKCFAIAFLDRTRRPETECWLFLSGEVPGRCGLSSTDAQCSDCTLAVLSLIKVMSEAELPETIHAGNLKAMMEANPGFRLALEGKALLLGTVHQSCHKIIKDAMPEAIIPPPVSGIDEGYMKYLFRPSSLKNGQELPKSLCWGAVHQQDFDLVRSRTAIPRQNATLALLPSLAIYENDAEEASPIAWAFLGPDGSLTSLHTESDFRGRGLAKTLSSKLFREGGYPPNDQGIMAQSSKNQLEGAWYHADVGIENKSSRAVSRGLGGEEGWLVYWIRLNTSVT